MKGPRPFRRNHPKRIAWADRHEREARRAQTLHEAQARLHAAVDNLVAVIAKEGRLALRRLLG